MVVSSGAVGHSRGFHYSLTMVLVGAWGMEAGCAMARLGCRPPTENEDLLLFNDWHPAVRRLATRVWILLHLLCRCAATLPLRVRGKQKKPRTQL